MTDETAAPTPHPEDRQDTYTDLTARLAAADLGWSHEHGDPPANPDYVERLAFQIMAFQPPLIAGVYVDDAMHNRMRDRLHGDRCGCGEWDSHSGEYVDQMDATIHAVLYPLRHPVRPVSQGTEDSPEVVCICGSMRFRDLMLQVAADETSAGRVVLMPFAVVAPVDQGSDFKRMLDTLHRRKIDMADRVIVVMDESEYYGESTRGEIEYASRTGKTVSLQTVETETFTSPGEIERPPVTEDSDYREQIAPNQELWRCDNGNLYRWSDQGVWEGMPFSGGPWWESSWDGPEAMVKAGLRLVAVPDALSWHVGQEVEWNPAECDWRPGVIAEVTDGLAAVVLHGGQRLNVETRHLRPVLAVSPLVEQLRERTGQRDRLRLAWQSAARGRGQARFAQHRAETDLILATAEAEDARDGGLDLAVELAEVRAEADRLSHELGQHRRVERDAYERHRTALVAALGDVPPKSLIALIEEDVRELRADLETRTRERDDAQVALSYWRDIMAANLSAMLRGMARRVGDVRKDWLNRVLLDWHCHNHDCHRGHASDYVGSYSVCLDCSTEDREVIWYRCDDNAPTPAQVRERVETLREAIQGWVAYKVRVVQQRRELADRFIAALGLAHPEPLQALPELVAEVRRIRDVLLAERQMARWPGTMARLAAVDGPAEAETPTSLADLPHEEWRAFHEAATGRDPGPEPAGQPEPQGEGRNPYGCGGCDKDKPGYCGNCPDRPVASPGTGAEAGE